MSKSQNNIVSERLSDLKKIDDFSEAISQVKQLLAEYPNLISGWLELGLRYRKSGDHKSALNTFQAAEKLAPKNQKVKLQLATEQLHFNQFLECHKNIAELLAINPENIRAVIRLGEIYRKQKNRRGALQSFQKALAINPQHLKANLNVAKELKYTGDLDAAAKQLYLALEYHPHNIKILLEIVQLEQTRLKLDLALDYIHKAIALAPQKIEPRLKKIDILVNFSRFDEAKNNLKILHQKYPNEFRILICYGRLSRQLGLGEKALTWFNLAQEKAINPVQNLQAQLLLIEELRNLGRLDEAIKYIDLTIQQFPQNLRAQMIKGSILQKKPNLTAAANLYESILSTEPKHLESRIQLAKTYSQLGQIETAIGLLEETDQLLGANIKTFLQLGSFHQALENWEIAFKWYQKACQEYPYYPQGYCSLANLMFLLGETDSAIKVLDEAQVKIPNSLPITIKLIQLQIRLGNLDLSHQLLEKELKQVPNNIQLLWQLCRLQMQQGDYHAALDTIDKISTDNQDWIRKTQNLRADIYLCLYNYAQAEKYLKQAISITAVATRERNRLAKILMLTGRIDEARQELKIATEELKLKVPVGKSPIPLKSHIAMVINELRINPPMMAKLQAAQQEAKSERILALGSLLAQAPNYLGTALYLARELRGQGIFDQLQQTLSANSTSLPNIPKRIIQFWDQPQVPPEVARICQSWSKLNPEYEYIRFSLNTAIAFLEEHYEPKVIEAFTNCDQPATQADFFRLAYLNKMGGFYADADDLCRQSLNTLVELNPELIILQEDFACIGNNFLGCIPGQHMIRTAFYQAVNNLSRYCNESTWLKTGPGLITSVVCSGLIPYLDYTDYQMWPRIVVLTQTQLRKIVNQHLPLAYKRTNTSWQQNDYQRRVKVISNK